MAIVLFRVLQVVYPKIPNLVPTAIVFMFGAFVPVHSSQACVSLPQFTYGNSRSCLSGSQSGPSVRLVTLLWCG